MLYHIYYLTLLHEIYSAMWLKLIFCKLSTNLVTIIIIRQDIGQMIMYLTCYRVINVYHTKQSCLTKHVMLISCLCLTYLLPVPWGPSSPSWLYPGVNKGTKSVCLALLEVCSIFEVRTIKRVDNVREWTMYDTGSCVVSFVVIIDLKIISFNGAHAGNFNTFLKNLKIQMKYC